MQSIPVWLAEELIALESLRRHQVCGVSLETFPQLDRSSLTLYVRLSLETRPENPYYGYIAQLFPEYYQTMQSLDPNDLRHLAVDMAETRGYVREPTEATNNPIKQVLVRYDMPYSHQGSTEDLTNTPKTVSVYVTQGGNIWRKKKYTANTFHMGGLEEALLSEDWQGWISEDPFA
jgi:hypothetical protein